MHHSFRHIQQISEALRIHRRGHRDHQQVIPKLPELCRKCEHQVGLDVPLVHLINHDRPNSRQIRIAKHPAQQHAWGDHFNPGTLRHRGESPDGIADLIANAASTQLSYAGRR